MEDQKNIKENTTGQKFDWKIFLNHKWVVRNIPFFFFLSFLAVLYIYNGHAADKIARKISATEKHIRELEFQYKSVKSEVIYRSKASELIKVVAPLGLKELTAPPIVLGDTTEQETK